MAGNETDDCPLGYADQWLRMRDTNSHEVLRIPDSLTAEQDEDCEYDEDQSYMDEDCVQMGNGNQDVLEAGAPGTHGESVQDVPPELHGWFCKFYTEYVKLLTSDQWRPQLTGLLG